MYTIKNNEKMPNNDPWFIIEEGFNLPRERDIETILSIGNGYIGTRDNLEEFYNFSNPGTYIAGIYEKDINYGFNALVKLPDWTRIQVFIEGVKLDLLNSKLVEQKRYIDLKQGICVREWKNQDSQGRITSIITKKFISLDNEHVLGKSITIKPENYSGKVKVISGIDGNVTDPIYINLEILNLAEEYPYIVMKTTHSNNLAAMFQRSEFSIGSERISSKVKQSDKMLYEEWEFHAEIKNIYTINSLVLAYSNIYIQNPVETGLDHIEKLKDNFYTDSLNSHINKLKERWNNEEITIVDDVKAQNWINYGIFRLIIAGEFSGNSYSIPARDLMGDAYKGHIFWDTDIYILPFFVFTSPQIARNLLMYRYNTLSGARENALKEGFQGAAFAWESALSGLEMAPSEVILPNGETIKIYSGKYEHHIGPDIVYAIWHYWITTQDNDFLVDYGAEIIFEVSRFCCNLTRKENDGYYHIPHVMGPDEYHEIVDDDTYTNFMAQFAINTAVKANHLLNEKFQSKYEILKKKIHLKNDEINQWIDIKDKIYISYDSKTRIYEQFKGFFDLEYIDLNDYSPRTAPMDILLGRDKIVHYQVIKQADVIMALFLLARQFSKDIIEDNYDYYEPRTGHGSSLSPGIYGAVAARLGKTLQAYKYFEQTAQIDLNDNMGNAAGGVHIGSVGTLWMLVLMGFAGMCVYDEGLLFDPHLPDEWEKLSFSIFWRSQKITININKKEIALKVTGNNEVLVSLGLDNWKGLSPDGEYLAYKDVKWYWK